MRFIDRALENGDVFHTRMRFMVHDEVYDQGPDGKPHLFAENLIVLIGP